MTDVPIDIIINSKDAKKGANEVVRLLDQIRINTEKTNRETNKFNKSLKETGSVASLAKKALASLATAFSIRETLRAADAYNTLQVRIKTATRETGDYVKVSKQLFQIAQRTGTELQTNVEVFQRVALGAKDLGRTNQDVLKLVDAVQKLGVIGGSSNAALSAGLLQLGQGLSAGILRAEEFNSIVENIPEVANAIAKGLNTSTGQLRQMVLDGKVLSQDVFKALLGQTDDIDKKFSEIPLNLARAITIAKNAFGQFVARIDKALGLTTGLAQAIVDFTSNAAAMEAAVIGIGAAIALSFPQVTAITVAVVSAVKIFNTFKKEIFELFPALEKLTKAIMSVQSPFRALNALWIKGVGEATKFVLTIGNMGKAILAALVSPFKKISEIFNAFVTDLREFVANPFGNNSGFNNLSNALEVGFGESFVGAFEKVREEGKEFNRLIDEEVSESIFNLGKTAKESIAEGNDSVVGAIKIAAKESEKSANLMAEVFKNTANGIKDSFDDLFFDIFRNGSFEVKSFLDNLKDTFARTMAELATLAIARPVIIPLVTAAGGSLGLGQDAIAGVTGQLGGAPTAGVGGIGDLFSLGKVAGGLATPIIPGAGQFAHDAALKLGLSAGGALDVGNAALNLTSAGGLIGGIGGNFLANSIFGGDRGVGANIGGSIGAIAGSFIPVPVLGTLIGSFLGNAVGGLFGGKPSDKTQIGFADLNTGTLFNRQGLGGKKFSQENFDAVTNLVDLATAISDKVGGTGNIRIDVGNREGLRLKFSDTAEGLHSNVGQQHFGQNTAAFTNALVRGIVGGATDISQQIKDVIVNNIDFTNLDQALKDLDFVLGFESLFEEAKPAVSQLEAAMKTLEDTYKQTLSTVQRLGLSEQKLAQLREKAINNLRTGFDQSIKDQQLAIVNPTLLALQELEKTQISRRRDAIAVGGDLLEVEKLFALEREQILTQSLNTQSDILESGLSKQQQQLKAALQNQLNDIDRIKRGLSLSPTLSGKNALERSNQADIELNTLLNRVRSGDETVFKDLDNVTKLSLEASLEYYGSTAPYLERLSLVDTILKESKDLAKSSFNVQNTQTGISEQILQESIKQTDILKEQSNKVSQDISAIANVSNAKLLNPGEGAGILTATNPNNNINEFIVRAAKYVASGNIFDYSTSQFGGQQGALNFAQYVNSIPNGSSIAQRFNDIIAGFGGTPQQFASGTGFGTFSGLAEVGESGRELINFGQPVQIFSNPQSNQLIGGDSAEKIEESFARYARQSSQETVHLANILNGIKMEITELNNNIRIGEVGHA
jgi:tape measure domain-containing protein